MNPGGVSETALALHAAAPLELMANLQSLPSCGRRSCCSALHETPEGVAATAQSGPFLVSAAHRERVAYHRG